MKTELLNVNGHLGTRFFIKGNWEHTGVKWVRNTIGRYLNNGEENAWVSLTNESHMVWSIFRIKLFEQKLIGNNQIARKYIFVKRKGESDFTAEIFDENHNSSWSNPLFTTGKLEEQDVNDNKKGLGNWFSGKPYIVVFDDVNLDSDEDYFVQIDWALASESEGWTFANYTPIYSFNNKEDKQSIDELENFNDDLDTNSIQDDYQVWESDSVPEADFTSDKDVIIEDETVHFTDESKNNPTSWSWDFGDGSTSTNQNPSHTYKSTGKYSVELTVENDYGSDKIIQTDYITVNSGSESLKACDWNGSTQFTDSRDGQEYKQTKIGELCWMAENLRYDQSNYGEDWCYDNSCRSFEKNYGRLYNWDALMQGESSSNSSPSGVQGICPDGWHVPSDEEWKKLEKQLGMSQSETDKTGWRGTNQGSKIAGDSHLWIDGDLENNTNFGTSGFKALPAGNRGPTYGTFLDKGYFGHWWASTEGDAGDAWSRTLDKDETGVWRKQFDKDYGFSVRCVKNYTGSSNPSAVFSADQTTISEGGSVQFTEESTNNPTSWSWDFGDGNTSTSQNPSHTYSSAGTYTVELTVSNDFGSDTETKTDYITVNSGSTGQTACDWNNSKTFTDTRDGQTYQQTQIGSQCWMAENLNYDQNSNGNDWCYDNNSSNCDTYGRLYDWAAVMQEASSSNSNPSGVQGVCPDGWHVPSDAEWKELEMELGMSQSEAKDDGYRGTNEGSKLAGNASLWESGDLTSDSYFGASGFSALPGGNRINGVYFDLVGDLGSWWSSSEASSPTAWSRNLTYGDTYVSRYDLGKVSGFSVRCVRDD